MEPIELALECADGIIDCRLEPQEDDNGIVTFSVTILYPAMVNGFSRSEIYCYTMRPDEGGGYVFTTHDNDVHPKISKLELQLSAAIADSMP